MILKNTLIVCMAGKSKRIKKLNLGNKAFIKINYKPMFKFVSDFFPNNKKCSNFNFKNIQREQQVF